MSYGLMILIAYMTHIIRYGVRLDNVVAMVELLALIYLEHSLCEGFP